MKVRLEESISSTVIGVNNITEGIPYRNNKNPNLVAWKHEDRFYICNTMYGNIIVYLSCEAHANSEAWSPDYSIKRIVLEFDVAKS